LCSSGSIEAVAKTYGLSAISLRRHLAVHVPQEESPATSRSPSFVRVVGDSLPLSVRGVIFEALERHPEAAKDVIAALDRPEVAA
jgi:hypothetical protein